MSTSILSENFKYRNASYVLDVRTDKEGLLVSVEQTVHHLDGTRTETTITVPTHILDRLNDLLGRVAEVQKKETEAKDPPVPLNQRGKLAKAYLQGVSIQNLSRSYGYSPNAITAMLKAEGLYTP